MKLPTAYQGAKIGVGVMIFSLLLNGVGYLAGVDVPNQREAVIGMAVMLIVFLVQCAKYRP